MQNIRIIAIELCTLASLSLPTIDLHLLTAFCTVYTAFQLFNIMMKLCWKRHDENSVINIWCYNELFKCFKIMLNQFITEGINIKTTRWKSWNSLIKCIWFSWCFAHFFALYLTVSWVGKVRLINHVKYQTTENVMRRISLQHYIPTDNIPPTWYSYRYYPAGHITTSIKIDICPRPVSSRPVLLHTYK